MIPQDSIVPHTPPESYGDCYRACVASITEILIDEVPHIWEGYDGTDNEMEIGRRNDLMQEWLLSQGFMKISIWVDGEEPLDDLIDHFSEANPGLYWIMSGNSDDGVGHTVVVMNGEIVHDPGNCGIQAPLDSGQWLIEVIGSAISYSKG